MHELAIAQSILEFLEKEASERGLRHIEAVSLNIGELSDVVPEALEFGFRSITFGTEFESVKLRIKRVPLEASCSECGSHFKVEDYFFVCPDCDGRQVKITSGQEIDISYIEVAEDG